MRRFEDMVYAFDDIRRQKNARDIEDDKNVEDARRYYRARRRAPLRRLISGV